MNSIDTIRAQMAISLMLPLVVSSPVERGPTDLLLPTPPPLPPEPERRGKNPGALIAALAGLVGGLPTPPAPKPGSGRERHVRRLQARRIAGEARVHPMPAGTIEEAMVALDDLARLGPAYRATANMALFGAASAPLALEVAAHHIALEHARLKIESLRSVVGAEQVERALWWAGPNVIRLTAARGYLAEGRTIDENGEWSKRPKPTDARELQDALWKIAGGAR